jgi:N6-adenosine-specific RNA methylase IME4
MGKDFKVSKENNLVNKKYQIIYADPPWEYTTKSVSPNRSVANHYVTMGASSIKGLNVSSISDINCYLFLWATCPNLDQALDVINVWGFTYKTVAFNWIKTNKNNMGYFFGLGAYTRANSELCLLGVKGSLKRVTASIPQLVVSEVMEHSHKPAIVRSNITQLYGDLPRIELFARRKVEGWDCWGNEVESDIDLNNLVKGVTI